ncbi:hypothetical protein HY642_04840 [Candidatus Woesearchaeota archaeon]|nr:hypothetical protein [Candidatus Woesearchaeota archaeon]
MAIDGPRSALDAAQANSLYAKQAVRSSTVANDAQNVPREGLKNLEAAAKSMGTTAARVAQNSVEGKGQKLDILVAVSLAYHALLTYSLL